MSAVAGTPVIDSPSAAVTNSFPSTTTRTMAAFRPDVPMVCRVIARTRSAASPVTGVAAGVAGAARPERTWRSEEQTSELQSRGHLVCRLLLEQKKKNRSSHLPPTNKKPRKTKDTETP